LSFAGLRWAYGGEPMATQDVIEQLLALPDAAAQRHFLREHVAVLDDYFAEALKKQADELLRSDLHHSLCVAELLLYLAELAANPLYRALGLLAEAHARSFGGLGEYERAVALLDEAANIYRAYDRPVDEARTQIGKVWSLAQLGRYDEAFLVGQWASRILKENAEWLLLAKLLSNLGLIRFRLGQDAEALALFDQARDLYVHLGANGDALKALARVEQNRSMALRSLGQFEASIRASQAALEMLINSGQRADAARAQQNLGVTYFIQGRCNEALELLDQAQSFFLADGRQRDAILIELFVSDCLLQLRRFAEVLEKCAQIRVRFTELGTRFEVAQALLNAAVAYTGLRDYAGAMASLVEARRFFVEEGNHVWVACADLEMAALLLRQGSFEASLATAQLCADVFQTHNWPVKEAQAYIVAARAAIALKRHEQALRLVRQALTIAGSRDVTSLTYQGHHLLGALAVAEGDWSNALAEYEQAIGELERLRGQLMVEFRADFLEDKQVVYEDMVLLCLDMTRPVLALEYTERAKSRALLDLLAYRLDLGVQAKEATDRPLVEELVRLRSERDRMCRYWEGNEEFRVRGRVSCREDQPQVRQDVLALEKRITELWHKLLIRNADYARDASLWQVRTEPIQPYIPPETVLLEYFVARGQIVAFVVTRDAVQVQRLPGDLGQVQRLIQLFWLNLKAVPRGSLRQISNLTRNAWGLLQQLYSLLIAPLGDDLALHPRWIVVPHGALHYLPFHALHDGRTFLMERHEISYLPGGSFLRYCQGGQSEASEPLVLGHSYGSWLPYATREACAVATLLGSQPLLEKEATLTRLQEAAGDCRAIHLATHGEFRPDNPLFSGLALADGWLTTLDIFDLRLKASLVTLSACQTGRNVIGGGDELLGLMRAFLYAGAASLVLSLWTVEDRSTARLMDSFYHKLVEGWTKAAALRHAQLQFVQREDDGAGACAHPYFWAPFFLVGDTGLL